MFSTPSALPRASRSRQNSPFVQLPTRSPSVASAPFVPSRTRSTSFNPLYAEDTVDHESALRPVYAKLDEYKASFYGYLPPELETLRSSDFYNDEFVANIDRGSLYTLLITPSVAYAWNHSVSSPSTCYIFPCPPRSTNNATVMGSFVPFDGREPGLLLLSSSGATYFWDSILHGLSGAERVVKERLSLGTNEFASRLYRCDALNYIIITSASLPFHLRLLSTAGSWAISISRFQRPASVLSRVTSMFTSPHYPSDGSIMAAAIGALVGKSRPVWLLFDSAIQLWHVSDEGWDSLSFDERQILDVVAAGILQFSDIRNKNASELDIELLDITLLRSTDLAILITYQTSHDGADMSPRRVTSLVKLHYSGDHLAVTQVQTVPRRPKRDLGATAPMTMHLLFDRFVVIHEGDALTFLSLNGKYSNVVPLKSGLDRILALSGPGSNSTLEAAQLLALTATGMMEVSLYLKSIAEGDDGEREENLLLNTLKQAVIYGALPHNPLGFLLPSNVGDLVLNQSARDLSAQVLLSSMELLPTRAALDMDAHLRSRLERLHHLIEFIAVNGAIHKLRNDTLLLLETDAEKLASGLKLWQWLNDSPIITRTSVFVEAVHYYLESDGESGQDVIRDFFRDKLDVLGDLLHHVSQIIERDGNSGIHGLVSEANEVSLIILRESTNHRRDFQTLYRLDFDAPNEVLPWTAQPIIIDAILTLFTHTERLAKEDGSVLSQNSSNGDVFLTGGSHKALIQQLGELARFIFSCGRERELWLSVNAPPGDLGAYKILMADRKSQVLESLVLCGIGDIAFRLAEDYGDFGNLAKLCYRPRPVPGETVSSYIDRYGEIFSHELFRFYLDNRIAKNIFLHEEKHGDFVRQFFQANPAARLSWMHDFQSRQYMAASSALLQESSTEIMLGTKHVMLSIGLLSQYAGAASDSLTTVPTTDAFDLALDLISVQQVLQESFGDVIARSPAHQTSVESKVDIVVKALYGSVQARPTLFSLIKQNVRRIIQAHCLGPQDLVDTICLADEVKPGADFCTVISLLHDTGAVPETLREPVLRDVWRRLYLKDDWYTLGQTGNLTDNQVNSGIRGTMLYRALRSISHLRIAEYRMTPQQASVIPSPQYLERRWPGHSPDQIRELLEEYTWESEEVLRNGVAVLFEQVELLEAKDREEGGA